MKNVILAILVVFFVCICLCGCENERYDRYSEKIDSVVKPSFYDFGELLESHVIEDDSMTGYLNYTKEQLSQFRGLESLRCLNWESFDEVNRVYTIDPNNPPTLPDGLRIDGFDACYSRTLNGIILCPMFDSYDEDQRFKIVVHELCHALLYADYNEGAFIIEGEVELLALRLTMSLGINPEAAYPEGVIAATWINELFGEQRVYRAIVANEFENMIDEVLGAGNYSIMCIGGYMAEHGVEAELGRNAELEILCRLSKALGKPEVGEKWLEKLATFLEGIDLEHQQGILSY